MNATLHKKKICKPFTTLMIYYFGIDITVCNKLQEEFYDLQIILHANWWRAKGGANLIKLFTP